MLQPARTACLTAFLALFAGACTYHADTKVTRTHKDRLPSEATYRLMPGERAHGGPDFARYATLIRDRMARRGYREVGYAPAELVLVFDFETSEDRGKAAARSGRIDPAFKSVPVYNWDPLEKTFHDSFAFDRRSDPQSGLETVYTRTLSIRIAGTARDRTLFEGRAVYRGDSAEADPIFPCLVDSLIGDFPETPGPTEAEISKSCEARDS